MSKELSTLEELLERIENAGITFTVFGLSIITHDGVLALLTLLFALGTLGIILYGLF